MEHQRLLKRRDASVARRKIRALTDEKSVEHRIVLISMAQAPRHLCQREIQVTS